MDVVTDLAQTRANSQTTSKSCSSSERRPQPIHNTVPHIVPRGLTCRSSLTKPTGCCDLFILFLYMCSTLDVVFVGSISVFVLIVSSSTVVARCVHPKNT